MTVGIGALMPLRPALRHFLQSLRSHNERAWFEAHRAEYDADVRMPLAALAEEVDVHLAEMAPEITGHPKRSLFRIHRDVRFSADKSPYKTNAACWFFHADSGGKGGKGTAHGGAGFYLEIGPDTASIGGGVWMPPAASLRRIRDAIDERPKELASILRAPAIRRLGGLATDAMLSRMPRGYAAEHSGAEQLRHRSFTVGRSLTDRELFGAQLPHLLTQEYATMLPLVRWLNVALGFRALARR